MKMILGIFNILLHGLEKYRWLLFGLIYLFGFGVYKFACGATWLQSAFNAASLFTLTIDTNFPKAMEGATTLLYIAGLLAAFYTIASILSLLTKNFVDRNSVKAIIKESYILVCGLGKKGIAYVESEISVGNTKILVIEKDSQNPHIQEYRSKGIPVLIGDAKCATLLKDLNIQNVTHFVLMAGKDIDNMEIALALSDIMKSDTISPKKLFMHNDDRGLDKLYKEGGLLDDTAKLQIKMFSLARNSARLLFLEHDVDGCNRTYMQSDQEFGLVVVGNSPLAIEVIGQICEIAHLPNQNRVNIYCIDKNAEAFKQALNYRYTQIAQIPNINIEFIASEYDSCGFYELDLWHKNITNAMFCYHDAQVNLDIAAELTDRTYLKLIGDKKFDTKLHIAIYENRLLAQHIKNNQNHFKYFNVFAETMKMASRDMVIDEKFELIAKFIHSGYAENYNPNAKYEESKAIDSKWNDKARLSDRDSSRAQAYHIPVKLKALGLRMLNDASSKEGDNLLIHNREFLTKGEFADGLKKLGIDPQTLQQTTAKYDNWEIFQKEFRYFPVEFQLLAEKLIRSEKNRWNAHHYLKGWVYDAQKNKAIKRHDCLVPIEQMSTDTKYTVLYDLYSILYMPNLLASVEYEIVKDTL